MVMQNPGGFIDEEEEDLKQATNLEECLKLYNKYLIKWLTSGEIFFEKFFELINRYITKLDDSHNIEEISKATYFTDLCKIRKCDRNTKQDFDMILEEIDIVKPDIVFCFGRIAWFRFMKYFNLNPGSKKEKEYITDVHGDVYKITHDNKEMALIPLVHMSPRSSGVAIKNSYYDYLKEGLKIFEY